MRTSRPGLCQVPTVFCSDNSRNAAGGFSAAGLQCDSPTTGSAAPRSRSGPAATQLFYITFGLQMNKGSL